MVLLLHGVIASTMHSKKKKQEDMGSRQSVPAPISQRRIVLSAGASIRCSPVLGSWLQVAVQDLIHTPLPQAQPILPFVGTSSDDSIADPRRQAEVLHP